MRGRQIAAAKTHEVGKRSAPLRLAPMRAPRSSSSARLAAAIAHEIRTPLAVALMYLRLVEQEAGPLVKESLRDGLSQARDEVARLDRLLAHLVDLHRHGHVMIRPGFVDAGRAVSDAVRRTVWELGAVQVNVEIGAADLLDWWDASAVDQIVHNLLSNAVQYADGRPCSVKVDRTDGALRVRVTDSGGGISATARARVFRRRIGPRSARAPGLGMGLWLVRELAEAHGGSSTVESRKGVGSTFTVRLAPQRP
jgi:signal transduction histidine kinase